MYNNQISFFIFMMSLNKQALLYVVEFIALLT
jgi:hypothetical protein